MATKNNNRNIKDKNTVTKTPNTLHPVKKSLTPQPIKKVSTPQKKKNRIPPTTLTMNNKRTKPTPLTITNKKASKGKEVTTTTPQKINSKKLPIVKRNTSPMIPTRKTKALSIISTRNTKALPTIDRRKAIVKHPPTRGIRRGDIKKKPVIERVPMAIKEGVKVSKPSKTASQDELLKSKELSSEKRNTKALPIIATRGRGEIKKRQLIQRVPLAIKQDVKAPIVIKESVKVAKASKKVSLDDLLPKEYPQNTHYFTNTLSYLEEITEEFPDFVVMNTWKRLCLNVPKKRLTGYAKKVFTDFALSIKEISNQTNIAESRDKNSK